MVYKRNERKFSNYVQKSLKSRCFVLPIESHSTLGIPDLYVHPKRTHYPIWVELKDMSPRSTLIGSPVSFEPGQLNRIYQLYEAGARVALLIYYRGTVHHAHPVHDVDRKTQILEKSSCTEINIEKPSKLFVDWFMSVI